MFIVQHLTATHVQRSSISTASVRGLEYLVHKRTARHGTTPLSLRSAARLDVFARQIGVGCFTIGGGPVNSPAGPKPDGRLHNRLPSFHKSRSGTREALGPWSLPLHHPPVNGGCGGGAKHSPRQTPQTLAQNCALEGIAVRPCDDLDFMP